MRMGVGMAQKRRLCSLRRRTPASSGAQHRRTAPFSITSSCPMYGHTSSSRCSVIRTVTPISRFSRATAARNSPAAMGSSWETGSSSSSTCGSITMTDARFNSCFCPPDSRWTSFSNQPCIPKKPAVSATRLRMAGVSIPKLSSPKASSCHTLSVTSWFSGDCPTKPMRAHPSRAERAERGLSPMKISPLRVPTGCSAGFICRSRVLFPQPEGPHSTANCPSLREKSTCRRAGPRAPG